jgi:predicted NAD-dependent protein-ADP-ribosyltransferase YbiA (DUF1768 family)
MVLSKIDSSISYEEYKALNKEDKDLEASLMILVLKEIPILATIGSESYTFISKNVLYVPIYLIYDSKVISKIGVFEFTASKLPDLMDEDDELDVTKIGDPLLFSFVTKEYLEKYRCEDDECVDELKSDEEGSEEEKESDEEVEIEDEEEEEDEEEDEDNKEPEILTESLIQIQDKLKDDDVIGEEVSLIRSLYDEDDNEIHIDKMETSKDVEHMKKQFKSGSNWLQKYFKNNYFSIEDNEGGGDCLFAVIRDAYKSIGKDISVPQLRKILAREATEEVFNGYKEIYDGLIKAYSETNSEMKQLVAKNKKYKTEHKKETNIQKKKIIIDKSKQVVERFNRLKDEQEFTQSLLDEYKFMHNINSLEDFRNVLKTCKFWGETWAISTLERVLNMKLIIFSQEAYHSGDYGNIIQCGQLNDTILQERGEFKPKYYIMTEWLGWHYKSILYRGKKILTFEEIPFDVKALVVDKCLERTQGPFGIIPKFKKAKDEVAQKEAALMGMTEEEELLMEQQLQSKEDKAKTEELFNDEVIFQFYDKSADVKPGKGSGEKIDNKQLKEFATLASIKHWRRMLSNYYPSTFEFDGKKWYSVAHYLEALKYKKNNPEIYNKFSIDSGNEISKSIPAIKLLEKKRVFEGKQIIPKDVKIDEDYDTKVLNEIEDVLMAKFSQNETIRRALKETQNAKLMLYNRKRPAITQFELMKIRKNI